MLPVAKVLKSNGTSGDVLVSSRDAELSEHNLKEPVFVFFDGLPVPFFIESLSGKGSSKYIVHFMDVENLEDAEELVGREIFIDAETEDDEEEYFLGWAVYDGERFVGKVDGFEPIPGNPCISVGDVLIPLNAELIKTLDRKSKVLVFSLPEGLI